MWTRDITSCQKMSTRQRYGISYSLIISLASINPSPWGGSTFQILAFSRRSYVADRQSIKRDYYIACFAILVKCLDIVSYRERCPAIHRCLDCYHNAYVTTVARSARWERHHCWQFVTSGKPVRGSYEMMFLRPPIRSHHIDMHERPHMYIQDVGRFREFLDVYLIKYMKVVLAFSQRIIN